MNIGIITYHRAFNYGAVLQCFALQELLKELGHSAQVIDYRQPFIEKLYRPSKREQILQNKFHIRALLGLRHKFRKQNTIESIFENFCNQNLNLSQCCGYDSLPAYDVYIIGSDQMWSIDCVGNKLDPVYWGLFNRPKGSKLIGFSISSNMHSIVTLGDNIIQYLRNFDNVSLRENNISKALYHLTSIRFPVTLDPTLCIEAKLWNKIVNKEWANRKYIALYHVMQRFSPVIHTMLIKQAKRIAALHSWEVIDSSTNEYSVSDFVSIIKYAQCVVTTSFHATVFSIIFSRPLFSVRLHDGNDMRYVNLLESLKMSPTIVDLDFSDETPAKIDYEIVEKNLYQLRMPSLAYLESNLNQYASINNSTCL